MSAMPINTAVKEVKLGQVNLHLGHIPNDVYTYFERDLAKGFYIVHLMSDDTWPFKVRNLFYINFETVSLCDKTVVERDIVNRIFEGRSYMLGYLCMNWFTELYPNEYWVRFSE